MGKHQRQPEHLPNAALSFIGLVACTVMGGELLSDILEDEDNFPQVPELLKPIAALVFVTFAALEANKVRSRLTKAWGGE
jgi:predicted nucleic acid-binding protein